MAQIEVLAVFKGDAGKEIHLDYLHLLPRDVFCGTGTPPPPPLLLGKRYRFYLKSVEGQPWYVNVCHGEYDDGFAMEPLMEKESDDNPPLLEEEAVALAKRCVEKELPASSKVNASYFRWYPRKWTIGFSSKKSPDAVVVVNVSDRKVDPYLSWFSKDVPGENNNPDESYIGKEVLISWHKTIQVPGGYSGEIVHFRGFIEKITEDEIIGRFSKNGGNPEQCTIQRQYIQSIQRIQKVTP